MGFLESTVQETVRILTPVLKSFIVQVKEKKLRAILRHSMKVEEAYNRALLVRLGCEAVRGDWHKALSAMAAVELMNFSVVIVDDIFDHGPTRAGKPTIHKSADENTALIISSILKSMATKALLEAGLQNNLNSSQLEAIIKIFEDNYQRMYIGQYLDISYEDVNITEIGQDQYLKMIKFTTGFDFSASITIGAILGKGNGKAVEALEQYGLYLGLIFQIRDDLIDYIDDESLIGKTPFLDFLQRKKRLPLIVAYKFHPKKVRKILQKKDFAEKDIKDILGLVTSPAVVTDIRNIVSDLRRKAFINLEKVSDSSARTLLGELLKLGCDL